MKRIIYVLFLVMVLMFVTACGSGDKEESSEVQSQTDEIVSEKQTNSRTDEVVDVNSKIDTLADIKVNQEIDTEPEMNVNQDINATIDTETNQDTNAETEEELKQENMQTQLQENKEQEKNEMVINIQIGEHLLTATLTQNSSTEALLEMLSKGSVTIDMNDYAGMEKVGALPESLPRNDEQINTDAGDLILYQGNSFVIYYDTNSWSLTRLGKINDVTKQELKEILGDGSITAVLSLSE